MDTVSNFPAVLASTDENGDTSDHYVASAAAAHDAVFAGSRAEAHASRDIVRDVWASSKGNACAIYDTKFELERSIKEQELRTLRDLGELKASVANQKEFMLAQALSDERSKRVDGQLEGIAAAIKALADVIGRLPRTP